MPVELNSHRNTLTRNWPVAFLSHTFTDTQWKWSTTEQEAYGIYYAVTKWNYYLQGCDIVVHNDHKLLENFLNGESANNKVNRWSLELATYNITLEWISRAHNKAADCLSWMVDVKDTPVTSNTSINMAGIPTLDSPATHTCSKTLPPTYTTPPTDVKSTSNTVRVNASPPLTEDHKDPFWLMQKPTTSCFPITASLLKGEPGSRTTVDLQLMHLVDKVHHTASYTFTQLPTHCINIYW